MKLKDYMNASEEQLYYNFNMIKINNTKEKWEDINRDLARYEIA